MKKRILFHIWIAFIVFIVVAAPFIVNAVIKKCADASYCELSLDGYLGYIGAFIGAVATIIAVKITIAHERKQHEQERILFARPWLTSESILLNSNDEIRQKADGQTMFVSLNGDSFGCSTKAPYMIEKGTHEINKKDCVVKYTIENAGGNTATKFKLIINEVQLFPDFAIAKGSKRKIVFVLPLREGEKTSKYVLKFIYGDLVSNVIYSQTEALNVVQDEYGVTLTQSIDDLLSSPKTEEIQNGQNEI